MTRRLTLLALVTIPLWAAEKHLFNGKDLDGWARIPRHEGAPFDQKPGLVLQGGLLVSLPDAPEDDLWYTDRKIGNATLRVVFKVSAPRQTPACSFVSLTSPNRKTTRSTKASRCRFRSPATTITARESCTP